jgi:hypothetical protein
VTSKGTMDRGLQTAKLVVPFRFGRGMVVCQY